VEVLYFEAPHKPNRARLWSYLVVGVVGAIIGGLLVVGIVPEVIIHRMGTLQLSYPGTAASSGTSTTIPTQYDAKIDGTDPWQVVVAAAEKVSPAVVGIVSKTVAGIDFFGREFVQENSGSGLIITEDGYIVTNNHVVARAAGDPTVFLADGRTMKAKIVGTDPATDLAVIKIEATGLPTATFGDSDQLRPGQLAIAIGNPLGMDFKRTVTVGVISGLDRALPVGDGYYRLIQTDAVINPGNSGGPLVNFRGEVIGLNSAKINAEAVEGMGFAIPSNHVNRIAQEIIHTGKVKRARVGVKIVEKRQAEIYYPEIKIDRGLYVLEVVPGGPAARAGIRAGDYIIEFAGTKVNDVGTFVAVLAEKSPGDTVPIKVLRKGNEITFNVVLGEATK